MNTFHFTTPGQIIFQSGAASLKQTYGALNLPENLLLVTDSNLSKIGLIEKVKIAIEKAGSKVTVFDKIEPEPSSSSLQGIWQHIDKEEIQGIVAIGGGSAMDVAKIISVQIPSEQPVESMFGVDNVSGKRLPLLLIPTTAGTGSEVSHVAVVTGKNGEKSPIVSSKLVGDAVILDAHLTLSLPAKETATTGVDAMVHAIEAYTSAVRKNPVSDQLAVSAFNLLFGNIRTATTEGDNLHAREYMLLGSSMAGLAFANSTVGAVHALAYPLGTHFQISHGQSNALVLTATMRFNLDQAFIHYAVISKVASIVGPETPAPQAAEALIVALEQLIPEIGLKNRLGDFNIQENNLDELTNSAIMQDRLLSYNIKRMEREDIHSIYQAIL